MSMKEVYKNKIETEISLVEAKLVVLKAQAENSAIDVRIKYTELISELEHKMVIAKGKLKEIGEANDDTWEHLKDGMENTWKALSTDVQIIAAKFKN